MSKVIGTGLDSYLQRQAREQAMNIVLNARDQADNMVKTEERKAAQAETEAIERVVAERQAKEREARAQARLAAQREGTRVRQQLIDRLWDEAARALQNYHTRDQAERLDTLRRLAVDAAHQLAEPKWTMEIAVSEADQALLDTENLTTIAESVRPMGVQNVTVAERPGTISGGLIARKTGSRQIVDNSFDERLSLVRRTLRDDIVKHLSGKETEER